VVRGLEKVHPHVFFREVVDGQITRLVHELGAAAVGHGLTGEQGPHPARGVLEVEYVVLGGLHLEVEYLLALVAERPCPDSQRHTLLLSELATPIWYTRGL
jgi:hypothetical protein